jgi:hypothetical protein
VERHNQELRDAEPQLERRVDGLPLDPSEESFLSWKFGDEFAIANQLQRVRRKRGAQKAAGLAVDRESAKAHAEQTAAQLATEGPRLRKLIEDAQRDLSIVEQTAQHAAQIVQQHDAALQALADPTLLNDADRAIFDRGRRNWERDYGSPARVARQRAAGLLATASLDPNEDREKIAEYCQSHREAGRLVEQRFPDAPPVTPNAHHPLNRDGVRERRFITVNVAGWQSHAEQLRLAAEECTAEAERLESEGQAAKAELDQMLQTLVPA